ncbi:MerR family transcriptional regulator [Streptococcus equi subsp. zooepidemicus]|uniref:MerR family transcriptional regulator n=1 Tax=Streptococcus equi TaxID=1336 RepID=UPI001E3FB46E|nr:MerR family transcriptional regulator [Streptococcus equi]MCD3434142.1 MerR family transcriptional regulator [Streptococcus equi subsp. zooepidemicus]HEL1204667.1 MerR family transcriptional regulator [Streptococcus equi subsp. zooepidemicus]
MLRNEIQNKTGLTRKAIEYYEEKGLINPQKTENGYRDYSENDLEVLIKVSLFRKLGISVTEIEDYLSTGISSLSSVLRRKQHQLEVEEKRKEVLELVVKGESQELINEKIKLIEAEESIYERLERLFPGYFGQMLFAAYQPFLNEPLGKDEKEAFEKYVNYLDNLPPLQLSKDEQDYIEKISSTFDMQTLKKVNKDKINAIENVEEWLKENNNVISQYEQYKNSEEYQNSLMKQIQDKLQNFMKDNKYYEIAIPLIRKFSTSYDEYYEKLLKANEIYLDMKK